MDRQEPSLAGNGGCYRGQRPSTYHINSSMPHTLGLLKCAVRIHGERKSLAVHNCNDVSTLILRRSTRLPLPLTNLNMSITRCLIPKLFLVIFVGSQVANLSDGKTRGEMSTATKILDVFSIAASAGLAVGTG